MRIIFDVKDEEKNEVEVGQVRKDAYGVFAIISKGLSEDKPFNAYLITENPNDDLFGAINWRTGTDAQGILDDFPTLIDAELTMKGAK